MKILYFVDSYFNTRCIRISLCLICLIFSFFTVNAISFQRKDALSVKICTCDSVSLCMGKSVELNAKVTGANKYSWKAVNEFGECITDYVISDSTIIDPIFYTSFLATGKVDVFLSVEYYGDILTDKVSFYVYVPLSEFSVCAKDKSINRKELHVFCRGKNIKVKNATSNIAVTDIAGKVLYSGTDKKIPIDSKRECYMVFVDNSVFKFNKD